eukprot:TRINITY_DN9812_c0_g1_i1.p1 TRINITY_DN9812_c0_g1~~TRINITY_DN9812_c0_g1_i1.p1  ORF type:complete len:195 (+),score=46.22 TRINITY_DN9812_c0_g1_i1:81-665(+)
MIEGNDVHHVLSDFEVVPVTFLTDGHQLNWLDPASVEKDKDIVAGKTVDLPLWLAKVYQENGIVEIHPPSMHSDILRGHLLADPSVVSMSSNPYFYSVGMELSDLLSEKDRDLVVPLVCYSFKQRFKQILDKSMNWRGSDYSMYTSMLTCEERELFELGMTMNRDFENWKGEDYVKLKAPENTVRASLKRRRED